MKRRVHNLPLSRNNDGYNRVKRIFQTIHIWGPCVVSIVTLVYLILFSWRYDSRLAYVMGRIDSIDNEIARIKQEYNAQRQQDWQLIETYRLEAQAIRVEIARAGITLKPDNKNKKEK